MNLKPGIGRELYENLIERSRTRKIADTLTNWIRFQKSGERGSIMMALKEGRDMYKRCVALCGKKALPSEKPASKRVTIDGFAFDIVCDEWTQDARPDEIIDATNLVVDVWADKYGVKPKAVEELKSMLSVLRDKYVNIPKYGAGFRAASK